MKATLLNSRKEGLHELVPVGEQAVKLPGGSVEFQPENRAIIVKSVGSCVADAWRTTGVPTSAPVARMMSRASELVQKSLSFDMWIRRPPTTI